MDSVNSNYYALLDALTKASSQNTELLKDAERQLKCWETQPGFYSTLLVSRLLKCDNSINVPLTMF